MRAAGAPPCSSHEKVQEELATKRHISHKKELQQSKADKELSQSKADKELSRAKPTGVAIEQSCNTAKTTHRLENAQLKTFPLLIRFSGFLFCDLCAFLWLILLCAFGGYPAGLWHGMQSFDPGTLPLSVGRATSALSWQRLQFR